MDQMAAPAWTSPQTPNTHAFLASKTFAARRRGEPFINPFGLHPNEQLQGGGAS